MAVMDFSYTFSFTKSIILFYLMSFLSIANPAFANTETPSEKPLADDTASITETVEDPFSIALEDLKQRSFKKKGDAIEMLQTVDDPRVIKIFKYMLKGNLYYRKDDKLVVFSDRKDGEYTITSVISGEVLGKVSKSTIKKITANILQIKNQEREKTGPVLVRKVIAAKISMRVINAKYKSFKWRHKLRPRIEV